MKRLSTISMVLGILALLISVPSLAEMAVGKTAPAFTAKASLAGEDFTFSLDHALEQGPVVVYFFPAAYTRGCDLEAHTFAVNKDKFEAVGATIIGVSADSIERLNTFSSDPDYCAGKFPVASDPHGRIAASWGLKMKPPQAGVVDVRGDKVKHGFLPRTTFVLNGKGEVVAQFSTEKDDLTPDEHVMRSLAIVRKLQSG